jgi:uncharacterized protein involved in response to NO
VLVALGFRPFYLLAGLLAALSIGLWTAQLSGWLGTAYLAGPMWHAHEMLFGYAFAVIVGFLFTAGRNWTGLATPAGARLGGIVALWLAARVLVLTPYALPAAAADIAFALAAAWGIAVPLVKSGNRRNYFFIALLLALGAANLAFHLAMAGVVDLPVRRGLLVGLDLVLFAMTVMGGRVIPMFTQNAIPAARPRRVRWIEHLALGSVLALVAADALGIEQGLPAGVLAGIAALAHGARLALWQPWLTRRHPIVWILHASYAWIVVHLALRALAALSLVAPGIASHALAVGAIGGLTLGMMTRTARGHTGRPLQTGAIETLFYTLVMCAAVARVAVPLFMPAATLAATLAAGMLWSLAFALFSATYWPILSRPRIDGKPG